MTHERLYYQLIIKDRHGRVIRRTRRRLAKSYVKAYSQLLSQAMSFDSTGESILDTGNTARTLSASTARIDCAAAPNVSLYGPVVGTGTGAVAIDNYALGAQIAHGTGSGQLRHQATTFTAVSVAGSVATRTITRVFINNSGASITIQEVGLYARATDSGSTIRYFCIARDLYSGGLAIPDGGSATLVYTLSVTT